MSWWVHSGFSWCCIWGSTVAQQLASLPHWCWVLLSLVVKEGLWTCNKKHTALNRKFSAVTGITRPTIAVQIKQECWHWLTLQSDGLTITSCATHDKVWWPINWTDGHLTGINTQIFHCQCVEDEIGLVHSTRTSDSRDCYTAARSYVPMWAFPSYINPTSSYSHIHCSIQSDAATQGDVGSSEYRGFNTDRRCRNCRYRK